VLLTAVYTAMIVWIIGLAVPVTASYIISVVICAPAMIQLGIPDFRSPYVCLLLRYSFRGFSPTALSCFAAAALTNGNPYKTTMYAWKYTLPPLSCPSCSPLIREGWDSTQGTGTERPVDNLYRLYRNSSTCGGGRGWFLRGQPSMSGLCSSWEVWPWFIPNPCTMLSGLVDCGCDPVTEIEGRAGNRKRLILAKNVLKKSSS